MRLKITSHKPIEIELSIEKNAIAVTSKFDDKVIETVEKRSTKNIFVLDEKKETVALIEYIDG